MITDNQSLKSMWEVSIPTVVTSWNGLVPAHDVQQELVAKLSELGSLSCQMFRDFFQREIAPNNYDGKTVFPKVILSQDLFAGEAVPDSFEKINENMLVAKEVGIYGLEFPIFDPRRFNSNLMMAHEYRVSFVFLRCEHPFLDGRIIQTHSIRPDVPLHAISPLLFSAPELELRYYLEHWITDFLGWVKHFYIPDLEYWVWKNNNGYDEHAILDRGDRQLRDGIFQYLIEAYIREAEEWKSYALKDRKQPHPDSVQPDWEEKLDEKYSQMERLGKLRRNRKT